MCLDLYVGQKPWKGLLYMMCINACAFTPIQF